ncbi:hypothetical protein K4O76_07550 [Staphylococcus epidermidis]|nr:hypothetical protein [Staphylococcus epidermidis]RNM22363.1 hypothetical protein EFY84_05050 [Staphylococcus epidermidis]
MYKNHNMTQLTLPKENSVIIPTHDMSQYMNDIVVTIPDTEFRHHRGATLYHSNMMLKIVFMPTHSLYFLVEKLLNDNIRMLWFSKKSNAFLKTINLYRVNPKADA